MTGTPGGVDSCSSDFGMTRGRSGLAQGLIACIFFGTLAWLVRNAHHNLTQRGITTRFGYLADGARFPVSESPMAYRQTNSYARAFAVGLVNTLYLSVLVIAASTVLGSCLPWRGAAGIRWCMASPRSILK